MNWSTAGHLWGDEYGPIEPLARITPQRGFQWWPTLVVADQCGVNHKRVAIADYRYNLRDFLGWLWVQAGGAARIRGQRINPAWAEWYMGFPAGWTALEAE